MLFIRSTRKRRWAGILAGAVLLLTLAPVAAQASSPAGGQTEPAAISGHVYSQMDPIGDVRVTVFHAGTGRILKSQMTDANGDYEIKGLPPGPIKMVAIKRGHWPSWAAFKDDWRHADVIQLHPGEHLIQTGENWWKLYMDVMPFSSIAGTVRGAGTALPYAVVTVYDAATGKAVRGTIANARGHFKVNPLRMGNYKVSASKPGWMTGYANEKATLAQADALQIWAGEDMNGDVLSWPHLNLTRKS